MKKPRTIGKITAPKPPEGSDHQTPASTVTKGLECANTAQSAVRLTPQGVSLRSTSQKTRAEVCRDLCTGLDKATGTPLEVAVRMLTQMANAHVWPKPEDQTEGVIAAAAAIREFAPRNAIEASLVAQMTMTGEAGQMFLYRATLADQPSEFIDQNVARARGLLRLHLEQIEALQKLRGLSGQQKVIVEHVTVGAGGQAIVGTIEAPKTTPGDGGQ